MTRIWIWSSFDNFDIFVQDEAQYYSVRVTIRGAKTDVRPYNFFLVRHKSRTKLKLYGIIYGCTAVQKDVRLQKKWCRGKVRKIKKVIDPTGPDFWKFKYLVGLRGIQCTVYFENWRYESDKTGFTYENQDINREMNRDMIRNMNRIDYFFISGRNLETGSGLFCQETDYMSLSNFIVSHIKVI